jgi:putative PIN family toxin of toxin-antitoxin system
LLRLWREEALDVLVSEPILAEYRRVLGYERLRSRHGLTVQGIDDVVDGFRRFGDLVEITTSIAAIAADPSDNMFIECAVSGEADYIVSGDAHLLDLREFRGIQVLSPAQLLKLMDEA